MAGLFARAGGVTLTAIVFDVIIGLASCDSKNAG
jgi:hypothetical protein